MRSSTSSSEAPPNPPGRTPRVPLLDRRVWVALLVVFTALEIVTRTWLFSASKDFRRFRTYPERARVLSQAEHALRVALIGNSATDRGVDARIVEAALGAASEPARVDLFSADQSRIDTWRFMFERYFAAKSLRPDLVVITFYENDLEDGNPVEVGRLAQFFTTLRDWPEVMTVNLHGVEDRATFALSSVSATFAARDRIRERFLSAAIPGFVVESERTNQVIFEHERRRHPAEPERAPAFVVLRRLLDRAAEVGIGLCFVAYPTRLEPGDAPYPLSPGLPELLQSRGAGFLDLRAVPALRREHYADEVHLTEAGRRIYSDAFGRALAHGTDVLPPTALIRP